MNSKFMNVIIQPSSNIPTCLVALFYICNGFLGVEEEWGKSELQAIACTLWQERMYQLMAQWK